MAVDVTALSISVTSTGIREASNQLGGLSTSAVNATQRILALTEAIAKFNTAAMSVNTVNSSLSQALKQMSAMTGATAAAAESNKKLTASSPTTALIQQRRDMEAYNTSARQYAQAHTEAIRMNNALDKEIKKASISQRQHNDGMREAHGLARGLSGSLGALWLTYGNLAGMLAGVAIGSGLKAIFVMGKDIEHTLEGIRVKGMESVDSINKLRESILDLGTGIYGPQEVAKAFDILVMAGLNAQQAMVAMKDALNLALIGGTTVEKAAFTLVQVGTALGYTAEGYSRIGDVIAKTAAVSMSSVESLSEAFKSGSVVGKLYGASLVDIGVAFAALSNLGIRGSAAGTSLKNMYKELAADSDKLKNTLNLIGLKPQNLKDIEGNFLPMVQLFSTLDGALSKYTAAEQKTLLARMANERGMKSLVELLSLYRIKIKSSVNGTEEFTTALEGMAKAIDESYGFMAQGAAAMALTVDSQFKSVKNTLQTSLIKAFQDIQPELSLVARSLKSAFNSSEFITAIGTIAKAVASFIVLVVENAEVLGDLLKVFLAYKAAMVIVGVITGIGAAILVMEKALIAARVAAIAFQVSLGVVGIALAAGAFAISRWLDKRDEMAQSDSSKAAISYVEDFTNKLKENTQQIREQIEAMVNGKTAAEAYVDAQNRVQLQKVKEQNQTIVGSANESRAEVYSKFSPDQKIAVQNMLNGIRPRENDMAAIDAINKYKVAVDNVVAAQRKALQLDQEATQALNEHIQANKVLAEITQREADEKNRMGGGTETIPEEIKKAAINASMNKQLKDIQGEIDLAKRAGEQAKENAQSAYKQGMIGELTLIERIRDAEATRQATYGEKAAEKISVLRKHANQESAIAQETANLYAALQATKDANQDAVNKRAEFGIKLEQDTQKLQAETFLKSGQFSKSYEADEAIRLTNKAKALQDNYNLSNDYMEMVRLQIQMEATEAELAAGRKVAANREAEASFNLLADATKNAMKGIQTASEGQGIAAMFTAASEASAKYQAELPELQKRMAAINDPKDVEEARARLTNLAETQKKMWGGVAESISTSLQSAFGKGGKAAGDMIKIAVDYNNLDKKTASSRIKAYGDMAGAAKGFFKEGSTGYKVLEAAEKGFRIVEMLGMQKSLVAAIANSAKKALAYVPEFMMAWGKMGPWGYAAGAAAIAAIGLSFAGGGGSAPESSETRQKNQGTGSVLGSDAKSESIVNSLAIMEKNSGLGLVHSNEMVKHLRTLAVGISNLASMVVRTSGITGSLDPDVNGSAAKLVRRTGNDPATMLLDKLSNGFVTKISDKVANFFFGGKVTNLDTGFTMMKTKLSDALSGGIKASQFTDTKKDGGLFRSDKYGTKTNSLGSEADDQFSKIIGEIANSIKSAASIFGMSAEKINSFVIDIGKISLKGLNGAQIKEQLEAVFSKLGDDMAKFALVGLDKFQQVGEGYLETVARLANNLMQVRDVFAVLDKTFGLTGIAALNVSESLVAAAGGLEALTSGTKYFVDNFLTEAERMGPITASVAKRLAELNVGELTTIELFKKKVRALDLTNAADQKLYAALIEIAPAFKEAADYASELAEGVTKLTKAQQKALDAVNKARDNLQKAYDKESSALQNTIDKTKSFISTLKAYQDSIKLGADSPFTNMQKYAEARKQFDATAAAARGGDQGAKDKLTGAASALLSASRIINASGDAYTSDFNMVQTLLDQMIGEATTQMDVATASLAALNKQVEGLLKLNESVMSVTQAVIELKNAIILGGLAGLTNAQMETTYVPTQAEVTAATPVAQQNQQSTTGVIQGIAALTAEVVTMRAELAAQTGAQIGAIVKSNEANAEAIVEAVGSTGGGGGKVNRQIQLV